MHPIARCYMKEVLSLALEAVKMVAIGVTGPRMTEATHHLRDPLADPIDIPERVVLVALMVARVLEEVVLLVQTGELVQAVVPVLLGRAFGLATHRDIRGIVAALPAILRLRPIRLKGALPPKIRRAAPKDHGAVHLWLRLQGRRAPR